MRTALLLLASAVPALADDPEPPATPDRQQLLLELRLPPLGLPPVGKAESPTPTLEGTDLRAYPDRAPEGSSVRKAARAAQVALWACSHEAAPVPLQIEVAAARRKGRIDPDSLKLRYAVPAGPRDEADLKDALLANGKQMSRLYVCLDDALEGLKEVEPDVAKLGRRWQAHVELLRAWLLLRLAALNEHQAALGAMRRELPDHTPGAHSAWRLAPSATHDAEARRRCRDAFEAIERIQKAHKGTAWARLARAANDAELGAVWQAVR